MKTTKTLLLALGMTALFASCAHHSDDDPTGSWISAAPQSVTENIAGATTATKTMSIDFSAPVGDAAGEVTLTADYDVNVPFITNEENNTKSYQAKATIKGTWTQDVDDHDDYLLTFDRNTLTVNGVNAPELGPVTDNFLNSLARFTTIEDVEISKDGAHLTFESANPDMKYHFVRKQ